MLPGARLILRASGRTMVRFSSRRLGTPGLKSELRKNVSAPKPTGKLRVGSMLCRREVS